MDDALITNFVTSDEHTWLCKGEEVKQCSLYK